MPVFNQLQNTNTNNYRLHADGDQIVQRRVPLNRILNEDETHNRTRTEQTNVSNGENDSSTEDIDINDLPGRNPSYNVQSIPRHRQRSNYPLLTDLSVHSHTNRRSSDPEILKSHELISKLYNYMKISEMDKYGIIVFETVFIKYLPFLCESDLSTLVTSYWCNDSHFEVYQKYLKFYP